MVGESVKPRQELFLRIYRLITKAFHDLDKLPPHLLLYLLHVLTYQRINTTSTNNARIPLFNNVGELIILSSVPKWNAISNQLEQNELR